MVVSLVSNEVKPWHQFFGRYQSKIPAVNLFTLSICNTIPETTLNLRNNVN